ncbi:DUF6559 family protein [Vreelandella sp. EE7]
MWIWEKFRKKRALDSYIKQLPNILLNDYGRSGGCNPEQIRRSIERSGLNAQYVHYALAIYADPFKFWHGQPAMAIGFDYHTLCQEVGDRYFNGNADFSASDIAKFYSNDDSSVAGGSDGGSDMGEGCGGGGNGGSGP